MARIATVRWRAPAPASIDEELVLYDDGVAWLRVLRPRDGGSAIGTWRAVLAVGDAERLATAAGGTLEVDLGGPLDAPLAERLAVADEVAAAVRGHAHAVATFSTRALGAAGPGPRTIGVTVVGSGTIAVEVEVDPDGSTVHFTGGGAEVAWQPLPALEAGFVTPDAVGLGGLRSRAVVDPGVLGAIAFDVEVPAEAGSVAVRVAGWLADGLPDEPEPRPFLVRTPPAPLGSPA